MKRDPKELWGDVWGCLRFSERSGKALRNFDTSTSYALNQFGVWGLNPNLASWGRRDCELRAEASKSQTAELRNDSLPFQDHTYFYYCSESTYLLYCFFVIICLRFLLLNFIAKL